jgi:asparagine synthase (glutamine-hydrolysing)
MCGILGTLPATDAVFFKNSLDKLIHRGPDSFGIWSDESNVSLGHRRLAILDLSQNASQPFFDVTKRFSIVYNGEIYNFIEIRNELEKKGYQFQSESDTEVLLYAFIEWGEKCLLRLNGMWAFAIWDSQKKELFLGRDRFGKKPLFYAHINGKFIFASEMKAIIPFLNQVRPSKNFKWMAENVFLYESTEYTLIEGIKRFPFGHYGYFKDNKLSCTRYWNTLDHLIELPEKYEDQVEEFRELFIDSCRIRMRSDVSVGTALSGGLDSSATISIMAHIAKLNPENRVSSDWQHAFVATFPNTFLDESYYAKKVVDHLGIQATYLPIDPVAAIDKLEDYLYHFEEIYLTSPIPMIELYGSIRKHGIRVTLDGHGADELFSGYGGSLFEAIPDAGFNNSERSIIFDAYYELFPKKNSQFFIHKNKIVEYLDYYLRRKYDKLLGRIPNSNDYRHKNFQKLDNFNKHLYLLTHDTILPTLLRNYDRYAMASGVEIRMPFMDWRIVTYSFSLKWHSKIHNSYTKSIIRDALGKFMPHEIAYRKSKIGFNTPTVAWMKNELRDYFLDHIHSQSFKECTLINSKNVKKLITKVIYDPKVLLYEAERGWIGFSVYLWEKAVLKKQ